MKFSGLSYLSTIPELVGPNFKVWRNQLDCVFTMLDLDYVLSSPCLEVLQDVVRGANESEESFQTRQRDHADKVAKRNLDRANWQKNNKKCLKIMQTKMSEVIRASSPRRSLMEWTTPLLNFWQ
jgi:hypothetical protein